VYTALEITDALSGVDRNSVTFSVVDEDGAIQPSGGVVLDARGAFSFDVSLEASRLGQDRDGRRSDIIITGRDLSGNEASASVVVTAPHDQRK
jgi:hypothetical protein